MPGKSPSFVSLSFLYLSLSLFLFFFSLLHRIPPLGLFLSYFHFLNFLNFLPFLFSFIFSFLSFFFSPLFIFDPHPSTEFVNKWGNFPPLSSMPLVILIYIFFNFLIFFFFIFLIALLLPLATQLNMSHSHKCTTWIMLCVTLLGFHVASTCLCHVASTCSCHVSLDTRCLEKRKISTVLEFNEIRLGY